MTRWATIAAIVPLTGLLAVGLISFFADPLNLPADRWGTLDQRASVVSMFIGAAGLIVAVAALILQIRADADQTATPEAPAQQPPSGSDRRTYGGDHIEFHHNTFQGKVVGKQVTGPAPSTPASEDGNADERG